MVLKELLPDAASPFRLEMAALKEIEHQRLTRLVQVFSAISLWVDGLAFLALAFVSIIKSDFFSISLALACLLSALIAWWC